jgi:hypothetical protein
VREDPNALGGGGRGLAVGIVGVAGLAGGMTGVGGLAANAGVADGSVGVANGRERTVGDDAADAGVWLTVRRGEGRGTADGLGSGRGAAFDAEGIVGDDAAGN